MSTASAETFPSRSASSAVWERALERHREDTATDITSDAIAPELGSICNHDTLLLLLFAKERRGACNMDTHWDTRTSDALRPILVDLELLLGIVTGIAPSVREPSSIEREGRSHSSIGFRSFPPKCAIVRSGHCSWYISFSSWYP